MVDATVSKHSTGRAWIDFFVLGTAVPAFIALVLVIDTNLAATGARSVLRALALLVAVFTLAIGVAHAVGHSFEFIAALLPVVSVVAITALSGAAERRPGALVLGATAVVWFAVSLSAWGVAGSLFWWAFPARGFSQDHLALVALVGSSLIVVSGLWKPEAINSRLIRVVGGGLAIILLAAASVRTNDLFRGDTAFTWEFYIGPAELVRQGGWLLWDVPAQYGFLSELSIAWMPTTSRWEALFILNSVAVFLLASSVFLLLRSLGSGLFNLLMSFLVALASVFLRPGIVPGEFVGPIGYPSVGGFRFLWCVLLLLMVLAVARVPGRRARLGILVAGNVVWIGGVLWSAESAIYSTFVWLPAYLLVVATDSSGRGRFLRIASLAALPLLLLAAALATVVIVYQLGLGHWPDPQAFFDFGLRYQSGFGSFPLDPSGPGWVLFIAYAATLVSLVWNLRAKGAIASAGLVAAAALIYATSSYFVGRSHPANVWNLAPEICIALAVALSISGRALQAGPLPQLLRFATAPILICLLTGTMGQLSPLVDYLQLPQGNLVQIDAALPATDANLQSLLDAHVEPGDHVAYAASLGDGVDPLLAPHWKAGVESDGAPLWLPLAPFAAVNVLGAGRRSAYVDRFTTRHPEGGWLVERTSSGSELDWVKQAIDARFVSGPTYANGDYQIAFWRPRNPSPSP